MDVNQDTLNLELIRSVGPGGQFLTTRDTLQKCRSHSWDPVIGLRGNAGDGSPANRFLQRLSDQQQAMLDSYSPPPMDRAQLADLDKCMVRQGTDRGLLSSICSQVWGTSKNSRTETGGGS